MASMYLLKDNEVAWNRVGGRYVVDKEKDSVIGYVMVRLSDIDETVSFPVTISSLNGWIRTLKDLRGEMQIALAKKLLGIEEE